MHNCCPKQHSRAAFTLLELMLVMLIIAILAALLLPAVEKTRARAKRIECVSQLRAMGAVFQMFAHDHGNAFPFQVSTNEGGTREFVQGGFGLGDNFYFAYRHFQVLSNELALTRLLVCPADRGRTNAPNFPLLRNEHISYFAGVTADYSKPDSWLSGDANLVDGAGSGAILKLATNSAVEWTSGCHEYKGNILFADGHVDQLNGGGLIGALYNSGVPVTALFTPVPQPAGSSVTVVDNSSSVLQQFFSEPASPATPRVPPVAPPPVELARPAEARAATNRTRPPAGAMDVQALAQRALTNQMAKAATNRLAGLTNGAVAAVSSPAPGEGGGINNVFVFVLKPELYFPWWVLIMLLAILLAIFLGWKAAQHRRRAKLEKLVPLSPLGSGRP